MPTSTSKASLSTLQIQWKVWSGCIFSPGEFNYLLFSSTWLPLKMMENALDTLKTAFPQPESLSPTEDIEGDSDGRTMDSKKYRWELQISPVALFPKCLTGEQCLLSVKRSLPLHSLHLPMSCDQINQRVISPLRLSHLNKSQRLQDVTISRVLQEKNKDERKTYIW